MPVPGCSSHQPSPAAFRQPSRSQGTLWHQQDSPPQRGLHGDPSPGKGLSWAAPGSAVGWMLRFLLWFLWVLSPKPGKGNTAKAVDRDQARTGEPLVPEERLGVSWSGSPSVPITIPGHWLPFPCSMAFSTSSLPTQHDAGTWAALEGSRKLSWTSEPWGCSLFPNLCHVVPPARLFPLPVCSM